MLQFIFTTDQRDNNISKYNMYTEKVEKEFLEFLKTADETANEGQRAAVNIAYRLERLIRQEDRNRELRKQRSQEMDNHESFTDEKPAFPEA